MPGYSVFGLRLHATGPLPGLVPLRDGGLADVDVRLARPPWLDAARSVPPEVLYLSSDRDETGKPVLIMERWLDGRWFRLRYADGIEFFVDRDGTMVWAMWPEPWTVDDVTTYLVGSVLAFVLRRRGITCLHASAVAVGDRAVAIVGGLGAGKSTLAAAFAQRGHAILTDDVVALGDSDRGPVVHPGPPRVRLWPESVRALYGSADALPRLTPTWDKRFVDLTDDRYRHAEHALPLAGIYVLEGRGSQPALPRIEPLSPVTGLMALVAHTQANRLLDARLRAQEFRCLGGVVADLGVRRIIPHADLGRLPALCDLITDDVLGAPVLV